MPKKKYTITMAGFTYRDVWFEFRRYVDGNIAITIDSDEGPVGKATVNLETLPQEGCVWVKDYSENEGLAAQLEELGLIEPTGHAHAAGFAVVSEYRLIGDWADADD